MRGQAFGAAEVFKEQLMALQLPRWSMLQMGAAFVAGSCAAPFTPALAAGKDTVTRKI
jgi:hypothetical protein